MSSPDTALSISANLVQTLLAGQLFDRLNLWVFPLLLGEGRHVGGDAGLVGTTFEEGTWLALVYAAATRLFITGDSSGVRVTLLVCRRSSEVSDHWPNTSNFTFSAMSPFTP